MTVEALKCPNCGANLQIQADQTLAVCAYCNSNIRLSPPAAGTTERVTTAEINWTMISDLPDNRRLITDGAFMLDVKYLRLAALPARTLSSQAVMRVLRSETSNEFGLDDLAPTGALGHYQAPYNIMLNKRYVEYMRQTEPAHGRFRFHGRGGFDPVIIYDGGVVIGAIMPMKPG
jgi:hypothetical protein